MDIFLEDYDYEKYLELLKHYKRKFNFKLFGYCLMPNHIHLAIQPQISGELPLIMQCLTQSYTIWFNRKYGKSGRLWQGRFKNMLIDRERYFIKCISYIEENPVRSGLACFPGDYPWNSYKTRVLGTKNSILDIVDST